jgi:hypothetical protein
MNHRFIVNPFKFWLGLSTFLVSGVLAFCMFLIARPLSATLFMMITLLFLFITLLYGCSIIINDKGVTKKLFGKVINFIPWSEIEEVGVIGTKVFNKNNKDSTGTLYIYISRKKMTEEEQFKMMLKWPPRGKIYLQHTKKRMDVIQLLWSSKIETYNTGKLMF